VKAEEMLDFRDVIDRCPVSRLQKWVVAMCCAIALLEGYDAQVLGFLAPSIASSLGVEVKSFGPTFSASLLGLMAGALSLGALGDRWGRRPVLILSTASFGLFALASAFATTLQGLLILRFLTGLGFGGALPNTFALATDYTPRRSRNIAACLISAAIPAGGMCAGFVTSALLPLWGWRSVLVVGGIAPLALAVAAIFLLPESLPFLCSRGGNESRTRGLMIRIWHDSRASTAHFVAAAAADANASVRELFHRGRAIVTLSFWLAWFMNLLVLYFVVNWMPALLNASGLPSSVGILAVTLFSLGGVAGSLLQGPLLARYAPLPVFLTEFAAFILLTILLGEVHLSSWTVGSIALAAGIAVQGAQAGINASGAAFYPAPLRSTGLGWGLGIGRLGSIVGPILGGLALQAGWTPKQIFLSAIVPAVCAALGVRIALSRGRAFLDAGPSVHADPGGPLDDAASGAAPRQKKAPQAGL
jgi:AAHS family 4-hydroxybenzoate transporter-like MFS transporter